MATLTGSRAGDDFPVFQPLGTGLMAVAYGSYSLTANPTAADVIRLCRLPAGAVVLGGFLRGSDIDTNGTPTLDIDVGWAANGVESADADGFGNFGVLNGTAVTNYLPEGGFLIPLHGVLATAGPQAFSAETIIQATVNAVAATFAAGVLTVVIFYTVPS